MEMQLAQDFDSPSVSNVALNESQWAQMPTFLTQSMPLSGTAGPERTAIKLELDTYLKVLPVSSGVNIDILGFGKARKKLILCCPSLLADIFVFLSVLQARNDFFLVQVMSLPRITLC
jgi:hypothetical protein